MNKAYVVTLGILVMVVGVGLGSANTGKGGIGSVLLFLGVALFVGGFFATAIAVTRKYLPPK